MDSQQTPPGQTPQGPTARQPSVAPSSPAQPSQPRPYAPPQPEQPVVVSPGVRPARSIVRRMLTLMMDVLFLIAVVLLVRLVMAFSESLSTLPLYEPIPALTRPLVLPLGIADIRTPFRGFFEVNAAVTILAILVLEYLLGAVRRNT